VNTIRTNAGSAAQGTSFGRMLRSLEGGVCGDSSLVPVGGGGSSGTDLRFPRVVRAPKLIRPSLRHTLCHGSATPEPGLPSWSLLKMSPTPAPPFYVAGGMCARIMRAFCLNAGNAAINLARSTCEPCRIGLSDNVLVGMPWLSLRAVAGLFVLRIIRGLRTDLRHAIDFALASAFPCPP
jgi:hypothetical protein